MGVGEAVRDAERLGDDALRVCDLMNEAVLRRKLDVLLDHDFDGDIELLLPGRGSEVGWLGSDSTQRFLKARTTERIRLGKTIDREQLVRSYRDFATTHSKLVVRDEDRMPELLAKGHVVMEGAQGSLLDPIHGFAPYVTKTRCTTERALELGGLPRYLVRVVGVLRAFAHRHGPGPLPSESEAAHARLVVGEHNQAGRWQGSFRAGWFDLVLGRLGVAAAGGVDEIALTCLDRLAGLPEISVCVSWAPSYETVDELALPRLQLDREKSGRLVVRGLRTGEAHHPRKELADFLATCRPHDMVVRPSWHALGGGMSFGDLPPEARGYVELLASGLGTRIGSVSSGPTHESVMPVTG